MVGNNSRGKLLADGFFFFFFFFFFLYVIYCYIIIINLNIAILCVMHDDAVCVVALRGGVGEFSLAHERGQQEI